MDTTPSSVNKVKNVAKYTGHTDREKREVKVKITYIHQLNQVNLSNQLQIDPD